MIQTRRDWIMLFVVMVNVNREPPDRVAESPATVLCLCRQGKCQRGAYHDYCGQDSDCISGYCRGTINIAKCQELSDDLHNIMI